MVYDTLESVQYFGETQRKGTEILVLLIYIESL